MKLKRSLYLSDEISSQYPIEKYKKLILDVIDIVENFIVELGDESKYDSSSTARYDECIGSHQFSTTSIIESMDTFWTLNAENKERISEFKTIIENKTI